MLLRFLFYILLSKSQWNVFIYGIVAVLSSMLSFWRTFLNCFFFLLVFLSFAIFIFSPKQNKCWTIWSHIYFHHFSNGISNDFSYLSNIMFNISLSLLIIVCMCTFVCRKYSQPLFHFLRVITYATGYSVYSKSRYSRIVCVCFIPFQHLLLLFFFRVCFFFIHFWMRICYLLELLHFIFFIFPAFRSNLIRSPIHFSLPWH